MTGTPAPAQRFAPGFAPAIAWDVERIRGDFPILSRQVYDQPLTYLDNAASAQKPSSVIEAVGNCYRQEYANVHRGIHFLSEHASAAYEAVRRQVQEYIHASSPREIVFVRGTTEAINLVAQSYGRPRLGPWDEILITEMEHHSNIVPWQMLCEQTGARLLYVPIDDRGELVREEYERLLGPCTRLVAVTHVSNALGTVNDIRWLVERAHANGTPVLVDGAQAIPHMPIDVTRLDCDFYAFSAHKFFGPTGIGILYGKERHLENMPPWEGGGNMIRAVTMAKAVYNESPHRFEAGTPHIAGVMGLGAAIRYMESLDPVALQAHEAELLQHASAFLREIPGVRLVGTAERKCSLLSFTVDGIHPHDLGTVLDQEGIAIRAGHHCSMPVMERFRIPATARASFAFYNTIEEAGRLADALRKAVRLLS